MNTQSINTSVEQAFQSLVNGTTHIGTHGVVGTSREVRSNIWEAFRRKYSNSVSITINGVNVHLTANHSLSGKSTSYHAGLTKQQYIDIASSDFGYSDKYKPCISIDNGIVIVSNGNKYYFKVENQKTTIN
jgi:hypothetical protein